MRELRDVNLNQTVFASLSDTNSTLRWVFLLFPGLKSGGVLFLCGQVLAVRLNGESRFGMTGHLGQGSCQLFSKPVSILLH